MNKLDASSRIAFAALIHDLGKFAQRADINVSPEAKGVHQQLYCPRQAIDSTHFYWSHLHAAYTALGFESIEKSVPELLKGDMYPFAGISATENITDSLINAAAQHHNPETFLQWIVATADRVSSGFEREVFDKYNQDKEPENHYRARLRSILEEVHLPMNGHLGSKTLDHAYTLKPLSADSLFPIPVQDCEPKSDSLAKSQYLTLWNDFVQSLNRDIPSAHRCNWALWLDHFDSAWQTYTGNIPSATAFGVVPNVSLYDHSKSTAALATALWRWHEENNQKDECALQSLKERDDWNQQKFLLIQGDFFGIQSFIFAEGSKTNKHSAKLLRGRSFYVSLLTELAALKVLETLELPPTSQIINAAGKFVILAPNTPETIEKLEAIKAEFNDWFITNTLGVSGLGLAWIPASCNDFVLRKKDQNFSLLMRKLFETMEVEKLQRFNLAQLESPIVTVDYSNGVNDYDEHLPANSFLPQDQIRVGEQLVKAKRILVVRDASLLGSHMAQLKLPIFGYTVAFTQDEEQTGQFSELAKQGLMCRCWDFTMPEDFSELAWNGYARRHINGYVPRFEYDGEEFDDRYRSVTDPYDSTSRIKTFAHLACEDRKNNQGQIALAVLKGDIDNLGKIFQEGLIDFSQKRYLSFAKMAGLSRQINAFFAIYLPVLCKKEFPDTYTVFSGGDDFFLIGPWYQIQQLAYRLRAEFERFVTNTEIHFSAGIAMVKPNIPPNTLAEMGEEALSQSKSHGKNSATIFSVTVPWENFESLREIESMFEMASIKFDLSSGYFYSLFQLLELSKLQATKPEASIWRSKLFYKTVRMIDRHNEADRQFVLNEFLPKLVSAIEKHTDAIRIPLSNFFYKLR